MIAFQSLHSSTIKNKFICPDTHLTKRVSAKKVIFKLTTIFCLNGLNKLVNCNQFHIKQHFYVLYGSLTFDHKRSFYYSIQKCFVANLIRYVEFGWKKSANHIFPQFIKWKFFLFQLFLANHETRVSLFSIND